MDQNRPSFSESVAEFRQFLSQNGWSDEIRWITAADITGYRRQFWIYRPREVENEQVTRDFYNAVIATESSVRLDAIFQYEGLTLAWVEDYGGDSHLLNYGIYTGSSELKAVTSSCRWYLIKAFNRLRGESPLMRHTTIPARA